MEEAFPEAIEGVVSFRGESTVVIRKDNLIDIATFLRDEPDLAFDFLSMVCAVDYLPANPRFEVVYHLYSTKHLTRIRLKVRLEEDDPQVESVTALWPTADWHERETYDMFGIRFSNHPDLRRILLPEDWEGFPLRKDYPLTASPDSA